MTFKQSVQICLGSKYFFKFNGRASRSEYWWFALFIFLINIASAFFWLFPINVAMVLNFLLGLALFPASIGVTVRRLHDRNLSGWWILAPIALLIMLGLSGASASGFIIDILSFGLTLVFIIIFAMPSYPGPNKYGANPINANNKLPY